MPRIRIGTIRRRTLATGKSHGGADAEGFASATELGYEMARENLMAKVREMVAATARPGAAPAESQQVAGAGSDQVE